MSNSVLNWLVGVVLVVWITSTSVFLSRLNEANKALVTCRTIVEQQNAAIEEFMHESKLQVAVQQERDSHAHEQAQRIKLTTDAVMLRHVSSKCEAAIAWGRNEALKRKPQS